MSAIIDIKDLNFTYQPGSPYQRQALSNINFTLDPGEFLGIVGSNGSGKSTLVQHLNGLLSPTTGKVTVCGVDTTDKELRDQLWKQAGLVFQHPEQQLFEATIYEEVAYGPKNLRLSEAEVKSRVYDALEKVGLIPAETEQLAPITLSGGMRRRVAIAGILALQPRVLILDEPMAGLDSIGRNLMLDLIKNRQQKGNETTVMISHSLKDIWALADKIAVLDKGSLVFYGEVKELLGHTELLTRCHLELPDYLQVVCSLATRGLTVNTTIRSIKEAGLEITKLLQEV
ncbi:MAG TPA: energy-coupling factor transporter ATPase [Desulfosporosinus sp.]